MAMQATGPARTYVLVQSGETFAMTNDKQAAIKRARKEALKYARPVAIESMRVVMAVDKYGTVRHEDGSREYLD